MKTLRSHQLFGRWKRVLCLVHQSISGRPYHLYAILEPKRRPFRELANLDPLATNGQMGERRLQARPKLIKTFGATICCLYFSFPSNIYDDVLYDSARLAKHQQR